jgi:cytoskeletal protein RodZ
MKNDYEMYQSVLSKRNEHRVKKERQKRIIIRTVPVLACLVLTVGLGLGYWNYSKNIPNIPSTSVIIEEVTTTSSVITTSVSTNINSATTVSSTKTVRTTTAHTTEKSTTSVTETSINTETTEVNTTETTAAPVTEPQTQQTTVIETTVTVTTTTQSSANTTVTTHDDAYITTSVTTTSPKHKWYEDFPKVTVNGVTYYYMGEDDSDNEFTADEFLGYGTDFEGFYHDDSTIRYYTVLEDKNVVIAVTKKGDQIPFILVKE